MKKITMKTDLSTYKDLFKGKSLPQAQEAAQKMTKQELFEYLMFHAQELIKGMKTKQDIFDHEKGYYPQFNNLDCLSKALNAKNMEKAREEYLKRYNQDYQKLMNKSKKEILKYVI